MRVHIVQYYKNEIVLSYEMEWEKCLLESLKTFFKILGDISHFQDSMSKFKCALKVYYSLQVSSIQ